MDSLSKLCIQKAVINKEPYYLVKLAHRDNPKDIKYIFLNHSYTVLRTIGQPMLSECNSKFRGDIRGVRIDRMYVVKEAVKVV